MAGSAASWLLFTFFFSLLYQSAAVVSGLGGFCAQGGPYVIQTECPESVVIWAPLSIFGGLIAVGIGLFAARGFGAPVVVWAWPVLFVGLGVQFLLSGGIVGVIIGVMFVVMGVVPLIWEFRAGPRRITLGKTNANDIRFSDKENAPRTFYAFGRVDADSTVSPTPADWALSLGIWIPSVALGVFLGIQTFMATAAAG